MVQEEQKDFNEMLQRNGDMPKIQLVTNEKTIQRYGGEKMFLAPPLAYSEIMGQIPAGQVITTGQIREYLAMHNEADFTDPLTAGLFIGIAAWASHQRETNKIPYWRTLKAKGELNPKFPGGIEEQVAKLTGEGHQVIQKGRKQLRYYVKDYQAVEYPLLSQEQRSADH